MGAKAIALLSGGLDSTLAAKMMLEQGVEVIGLNFVSPFCPSCRTAGDGGESKIQTAQRQLGVPVRFVPLDEDYVDVIRHGRFGYGAGVNPCIDCRIYTMKKAKKVMEEEGADFIVSGEVLGQRPMSQRNDAMETIDEQADLGGILLRPLSAREMPPTKPEQDGTLDRDKLGAITGRSRKEQFALAKKYGVTDFPTPAGGCLLTDKNFAVRVRDLFDRQDEVLFRDLQILQFGRIVKLRDHVRVVVGRNERENAMLEGYQDRARAFLEPENFQGPSALILGEHTEADRDDAARMVLFWTKKRPAEPRVYWNVDGNRKGVLTVTEPYPEGPLRAKMI